MLWEALQDNCIFAFLPELEPLFGAHALIGGEEYHRLCSALYGAERIADWKRRYRFLLETYGAVKKLSPFGLLDFLLDKLEPGLTRSALKDYLLSLPAADRLYRQCEWEYGLGLSRDELETVLTDEKALAALYERVEGDCANYLAFSAFVRQNERYIRELFALADEMDCPALHDALETHRGEIEALRQRTAQGLKRMDPLSCSQELMGKTFRNRGPYESFYYLPTLLLPWASLRLFYPGGTAHNRQLLFLAIREPERGQEHTLSALKAMSDPTRYQILMLLARQGPLNGQDVTRALHLAPSTVSHHMAELREAGLVTEEQVKTAKYYGVSRDGVKTLLSTVERDLNRES